MQENNFNLCQRKKIPANICRDFYQASKKYENYLYPIHFRLAISNSQ
jgi:hypothetical protein